MTERQIKLQKLRAQAEMYAQRLARQRAMDAHPAGGALPNGDRVHSDPVGNRVSHVSSCDATECNFCGVAHVRV